MKRFLFIFVVLLPCTLAVAQQEAAQRAGPRSSLQLSITPVYQQYSVDGRTVSEQATTLWTFLPVRRNLGISFRIAQASVAGDVTKLSGFTDAQMAVNYSHKVGRGSVVVATGVNLPSGKQELSTDEFETLKFLGTTIYAFPVPSLGQGWGAAPSLTFVFPLTDRLVVGAGASYQYRGSFTPQAGMIDDYDPGNELLFTVGADLQLTPRWSFSADGSYTRYATDRLGDAEAFAAGDKTVLTAQLRHRIGFDEVGLLGRFRSRGRSTVPGVVEQIENPRHIEVMGRYSKRLHRKLDLAVLGEARLFEIPAGQAAEVLTQPTTLYGIGLVPNFMVSRSLRISGSAMYLFGDATGWRGGVGLITHL